MTYFSSQKISNKNLVQLLDS